MSAFTETALEIGRRLAAGAIWHEGRCNWVGPVPETDRERLTLVVRSLPPDLYDGTAGIGLALAEIAAITGDDTCRRTATAAVRQSLSRSDDVLPQLAIGLFAGLPGIALAALRTGLLLDEPELVDLGRRVAGRMSTPSPTPDAYDLIGGRAGAIVGLLAAEAHPADDDAGARARVIGDEIIAAAHRNGGWSWPGGTTGTGVLPSGLAHGTAGVAYALLELWAATGADRFRVAAEAAIDAEQALFDARAGNWLHGAPATGPRQRTEPRSSHAAWCHGAPGIGLARHRAWRLTGDETRRVEAAAALGLTDRWIRAAVRTSRGSFCLCHGLAGNAEILRDCADALGARAVECDALIAEVAETGIDEHGRGVWPCGSSPGVESPGLMLGLAGIARFYLRLDHPDLPSVLLPQPAEWPTADAAGHGGWDSARAALIRP